MRETEAGPVTPHGDQVPGSLWVGMRRGDITSPSNTPGDWESAGAAAPTAMGDCGPVTLLGHAPLSPFLACSIVLAPSFGPSSIPIPSSLPRSQLVARQDCRWAMVFCKARSDSPVGLLKHLLSLSQCHYELININSLFWYLLLLGALA